MYQLDGWWLGEHHQQREFCLKSDNQSRTKLAALPHCELCTYAANVDHRLFCLERVTSPKLSFKHKQPFKFKRKAPTSPTILQVGALSWVEFLPDTFLLIPWICRLISLAEEANSNIIKRGRTNEFAEINRGVMLAWSAPFRVVRQQAPVLMSGLVATRAVRVSLWWCGKLKLLSFRVLQDISSLCLCCLPVAGTWGIRVVWHLAQWTGRRFDKGSPVPVDVRWSIRCFAPEPLKQEVAAVAWERSGPWRRAVRGGTQSG